MEQKPDLSALFDGNVLAFISGWRHLLPKGVPCLPHSHATVEIVFHARGSGVTTVNGNEAYAFAEGSVVIYPPHTPHDQCMAVSGEDLCFLVEMPPAIAPLFTTCLYIPRVRDAMVLNDLLAMPDLLPKSSETERLSLNYRITSVVVYLLHCVATFEPQAPTPELHAEQAYQYLQMFYQRDVHLEAVAAHIGISEHYLRHLFKKRYGMSMVQWLMTVRIERARDLLKHSQLPLKEIARVCGFDNERYFSRVFHKRVGCPPGKFRALAHGDVE